MYTIYQTAFRSGFFRHIVVAMLLFPAICQAQMLTNTSGQTLWIAKGAIVTVDGGLLNRGTVTNNGQISVSGNWLNEGTYDDVKGKVIFNGTQQQQVNHNNQSIAVLQITGGGDKQLLSHLTIGDSLLLDEGVVHTNVTAPYTLQLLPDAIVNEGSESSYIDGFMVYKGTGYRYFPVGDNSRFLPLELLDVQGVQPTLKVSVQQPNLKATPGSALERVSAVRYWEVLVLDGTYEGSAISLAVGGDEGFKDLTGMVVAASETKEGTFESLGRSAATGDQQGGSVSSKQASALPYLALGITTEFSMENEVAVPTAFDPNASDERNRVLKIFASNIAPQDFVFKIFNRWGMVVYQTTSAEEAMEKGWDGMNLQTGQPAEFGVYTYFLRAVFDNQIPIEQTGTITLFR